MRMCFVLFFWHSMYLRTVGQMQHLVLVMLCVCMLPFFRQGNGETGGYRPLLGPAVHQWLS